MLHELQARAEQLRQTFEQGLNRTLGPAVMNRAVLWLNHVVAAEPQAQARLTPHAGKALRLELQQWPSMLPPPPAGVLRITPAGLFEWQAPDEGSPCAPVDLTVKLDAANPAALAVRTLSGQNPVMNIEGEAQLAADVDWLAKHLRWDLADDVQRLVGPGLAHQVTRFGDEAAQVARKGAQVVTEAWRRFGGPGR